MKPRLERFVTYAAAAAAVASLMPLAARLGWAFDLATHFRVQYVVLDALLAVALAAFRMPVRSTLLAGCAVLSAWPLLPYVAFAGKPAAAVSGPTIKLLSANVLYRNHSATRLLEIVRRESPDVVVLIEYTPEWAQMVDELRANYPHRLEGPGSGAFGIALFSRFELESAAPFDLGDTSEIEARVRTPRGALTLFAVHLRSPTTPWRGQMRNRQLDELATRVARASGPVAVIGDFNATPYSPIFSAWLARTGLTDTRRGRTLSPSWPTMLPIVAIPIDHCAVSKDVTIVAHRSLPAFGSDHYPILAELALAPPPTSRN
ncbi:MAG TPA: endonuclease/exonuclease/phosphatase family protein [Gammaproteobacteria bacterium]|nr:endonuclease/exonuclease/phosphatase family protein [Gammaproteobacteria bacterium]